MKAHTALMAVALVCTSSAALIFYDASETAKRRNSFNEELLDAYAKGRVILTDSDGTCHKAKIEYSPTNCVRLNYELRTSTGH